MNLLGDLAEVILGPTTGGHGRGTQAEAGGVIGRAGIIWNSIAVGYNTLFFQSGLGLLAS